MRGGPTERRPGLKVAEAESGSSVNAVREGVGMDDSGTAEDDGAGTVAPPGTGAVLEGTAGQEGAGTVAGTEESSTTDQAPPEMDAATPPDGAAPPDCGRGGWERGDASRNERDGGGGWGCLAHCGGSLRGWCWKRWRRRERAEPRREASQEEEDRMAAMEERWEAGTKGEPESDVK